MSACAESFFAVAEAGAAVPLPTDFGVVAVVDGALPGVLRFVGGVGFGVAEDPGTRLGVVVEVVRPGVRARVPVLDPGVRVALPGRGFGVVEAAVDGRPLKWGKKQEVRYTSRLG